MGQCASQSQKNQPCQHFDLSLPTFRKVRPGMSVFKPPSMWFIITAAQPTKTKTQRENQFCLPTGTSGRVWDWERMGFELASFPDSRPDSKPISTMVVLGHPYPLLHHPAHCIYCQGIEMPPVGLVSRSCAL